MSTPESGDEGTGWGGVTAKLVSAATVIFFFLLVPQIIKNASNLLAADMAALKAIAWVVRLSSRIGGHSPTRAAVDTMQSVRGFCVNNGAIDKLMCSESLQMWNIVRRGT